MGRENGSLNSSIWNGKRKRNVSNVSFNLMLKSERVLLAFRLVRGIKKWFLNFILGYRNFFAKFLSDAFT
ncbi:hypothetical protein C1645_822240 [Glomus cerebriforme]|uniref:Uncharacterized protein n=1 Tax=Glomus cerebriforme TaxID=658196 RepID=A0A397T346_9GLOM|nr:hypothetical protein C1645_822240 [Glomus cerebriforme]